MPLLSQIFLNWRRKTREKGLFFKYPKVHEIYYMMAQNIIYFILPWITKVSINNNLVTSEKTQEQDG